MDTPMFLFVGTYTSVASAEGDYEVIKLLHSCDEIGSYDAAVIAMGSEGTIAVRKTTGPELDAWLAHLGDSVAEPGRASLVVLGVEADAARIEQTAVEATSATLRYLA